MSPQIHPPQSMSPSLSYLSSSSSSSPSHLVSLTNSYAPVALLKEKTILWILQCLLVQPLPPSVLKPILSLLSPSTFSARLWRMRRRISSAPVVLLLEFREAFTDSSPSSLLPLLTESYCLAAVAGALKSREGVRAANDILSVMKATVEARAASRAVLPQNLTFFKRPSHKRMKWSREEERVLREGVEKFGVGHWAAILNESYHLLPGRNAMNLKDKWRNLNR